MNHDQNGKVTARRRDRVPRNEDGEFENAPMESGLARLILIERFYKEIGLSRSPIRESVGSR
ncbi:MAG: hypothetical protein HYT63_01705 [Candidatus Yanofskybacteria bacterium]|nr:hypothetical protein [Candidatus Yanofskybacteria bacterium]